MRVVLFGATGYTGRLTADALVRELPDTTTLVLAGRDAHRLDDVAAALRRDAEVARADATDDAQVRALLSDCDVLVTTVGPFSRWGMPVARAAAAAGLTYFDSTGEPPFVRRLRDELTGIAVDSGATLMPAFGYDYVPGNLAAELALREAPGATRVRVGYFVKGRGQFSGGTAASGAEIAVDPAFAWRGGRLVPDRIASRLATFDVDGQGLRAYALAGSEHLWLPPRHPHLIDVEVYLGWSGRWSRAVQLGSAALRAATAVPGGQAAVRSITGRMAKGSTGGPDATARAAGRTLVVAEAFKSNGERSARVQLEGPNPYDLTAELLAWGAQAAVRQPPAVTGVVGPVDLFGLAALEAACANLGLTRNPGAPSAM